MRRPSVSEEVIRRFTAIVDRQDEKGLNKYGETIDDASGYDWSLMALEESVDMNKYLVRENRELREKINRLVKYVGRLEDKARTGRTY